MTHLLRRILLTRSVFDYYASFVCSPCIYANTLCYYLLFQEEVVAATKKPAAAAVKAKAESSSSEEESSDDVGITSLVSFTRFLNVLEQFHLLCVFDDGYIGTSGETCCEICCCS